MVGCYSCSAACISMHGMPDTVHRLTTQPKSQATTSYPAHVLQTSEQTVDLQLLTHTTTAHRSGSGPGCCTALQAHTPNNLNVFNLLNPTQSYSILLNLTALAYEVFPVHSDVHQQTTQSLVARMLHHNHSSLVHSSASPVIRHPLLHLVLQLRVAAAESARPTKCPSPAAQNLLHGRWLLCCCCTWHAEVRWHASRS